MPQGTGSGPKVICSRFGFKCDYSCPALTFEKAAVLMEGRRSMVNARWLPLQHSASMNSAWFLMDIYLCFVCCCFFFFFLMKRLIMAHPTALCSEYDLICPTDLPAWSTGHFNEADCIMLLCVSLPSLGPFAVNCVRYLGSALSVWREWMK